MNYKCRQSAGFTIIELSLVLVVLGILAVALMPMLQAIHEDTLREQDMATMDTARDALLGYIRINEGAPCVDAAGVQVSAGCDPTQTLDLLGVRAMDSRRMSFAYDVNDTLTLAEIAASGNSLCTALANIIDPPFPLPAPPEPTVCASGNTNTGDTACTAANPMAMVLVGRGNDRCLNLENSHDSAANDAVCPEAVANNRTFENPARLHSRTQDEGYYEDLVMTVSPTELAEAMGCPSGGAGGGNPFFCNAGEKLVNVVNGSNGNLTVNLSGAGCFVSWKGSTSGPGCQLETETVSVHTNSACGGSGAIGPATLATLDSNADGRVDVLCDKDDNCIAR